MSSGNNAAGWAYRCWHDVVVAVHKHGRLGRVSDDPSKDQRIQAIADANLPQAFPPHREGGRCMRAIARVRWSRQVGNLESWPPNWTSSRPNMGAAAGTYQLNFITAGLP